MKKEIQEPATISKSIMHEYCSKEWWDIIDANQNVISVKKGKTIFKQGDKVRGIFVVNKGKVKVSVIDGNKKERILRFAGDNKILGHRGIAVNAYPITATALTDCTLTFLSNDVFLKLIKTNPDLCLYLINFLAEEIRETENRLVNLLQLEVKERMASIIVTLAESFGFDENEPTKLSYTLSRKDFASISGATYETVIRTLFKLQTSKLISLIGKDIHITNLGGLKTLKQQ
jgi:CRP/FNR family transcriptional regulator